MRIHGVSVEVYTSEHEDYQGQTFGAANKLHECYRSLEEFVISRDYIRKGELKEYFKLKFGLNRSDTRIPQTPKTVFDYI
jgi:hypothetical protein